MIGFEIILYLLYEIVKGDLSLFVVSCFYYLLQNIKGIKKFINLKVEIII